jgi:hypothetical protein
MPEGQRTVIIACAVFRDVIRNYVSEQDASVIFMDYGLHLAPRNMRAAIQIELDKLAEPSFVLIGFGLCGNGLAGIQSHGHTLIIPCVDDCVSLYLGSRAAYLKEFQAEPATYYLTPGWLECGGEPMSEHEKCCSQFGAEKAAMIADMLYGKYRKICFVAFTAEELDRYRPRALQVADFCRVRWNWQYTERIGSDALMRKLLEFSRTGVSPDSSGAGEEFVIIKPGEEVRQELFMLPPSALRKESESCTTCTIK